MSTHGSNQPQGSSDVELPPVAYWMRHHMPYLHEYAKAAVALNRRPVAEDVGEDEHLAEALRIARLPAEHRASTPLINATRYYRNETGCTLVQARDTIQLALVRTSPATSEPVMPVAPSGWQLVPIKLTKEMEAAPDFDLQSGKEIWRAMLAAAPVAPSGARENLTHEQEGGPRPVGVPNERADSEIEPDGQDQRSIGTDRQSGSGREVGGRAAILSGGMQRGERDVRSQDVDKDVDGRGDREVAPIPAETPARAVQANES